MPIAALSKRIKASIVEFEVDSSTAAARFQQYQVQ